MASREKKLVEEVLSLNDSIRYCGIISTRGKVIAGRMKKGVKSLEPESATATLMNQLAILIAADTMWDPHLGKTDYILFRKGKVNLLLFPFHGSMGVLVSTAPSFSMEKMDEISKAINSNQRAHPRAR